MVAIHSKLEFSFVFRPVHKKNHVNSLKDIEINTAKIMREKIHNHLN